jgi:hypothetical protein
VVEKEILPIDAVDNLIDEIENIEIRALLLEYKNNNVSKKSENSGASNYSLDEKDNCSSIGDLFFSNEGEAKPDPEKNKEESKYSKYNLDLFGGVVEAEGIHEIDAQEKVIIAYKMDTEIARKIFPNTFSEYKNKNGKEFLGTTLIVAVSQYNGGLPSHGPRLILLEQYSEKWDSDPKLDSKFYDPDYDNDDVWTLMGTAIEIFFGETYGIFIDDFLEEKYSDEEWWPSNEEEEY